MLVSDWMTREVECVRPDDDVASVEQRLRVRLVRQFPVVSGERLVGIITDRDVRTAADPHMKVAAAMTSTVHTTTPGRPVEEAAAMLRDRKIGALPVVEGGKLVGIISESDLLAALVELCALLEPTALIEVECEEGEAPIERIRSLLEARGGRVPWLSGRRSAPGRQRVAIRVRMPVGRVPEQMLEEAGFAVLSCITGVAATGRGRGLTAGGA